MDSAIMGGSGINTESFPGLATITIAACRRDKWRKQSFILSGGGPIGGGNYCCRIQGVVRRAGFKLGARLTLITLAGEPFEAT